MKTLRLFISSPGDVGRERHATAEVIRRLQSEFAEHVMLDPYFWEWEPVDFSKDYQANIPSTADFDIVICILWSRLGSRLSDQHKLPPDYTRPASSGTEYELLQALHGQQQHPDRLPDLLVWKNDSPPPPASAPPLTREQEDERIRQRRALQDFLTSVTRDANTGSFIAALNSYTYLDEFEDMMDKKLRKLIQKHIGQRTVKPKPQWQGSPFRDLDVFEFEHAPIFFGRSRAVGEVVRLLQSTLSKPQPCHFALILGASGSGKSSLARAGVLPLLTRPGVIEGIGLWRCAIVRPSDDSADLFQALAAALLNDGKKMDGKISASDSSSFATHIFASPPAPPALPELADPESAHPQQSLAAELRAHPQTVAIRVKDQLNAVAKAHQTQQRHTLEAQIASLTKEGRQADAALKQQALQQLHEPKARLVLLLDQMEELFTLNYAPEQLRAFLETIAVLARSGRVFVIGTLRNDFYPRYQEQPTLVALARDGARFDLLPPTPDEISQIIRRPASLAALQFEPHLTTAEHTLADTLRDEALADPEALPLLEHVLNRLYQAQLPRADGRLTFADYEDICGVDVDPKTGVKTSRGVGGALGKHAEDIFTGQNRKPTDPPPPWTEDTFRAVFRCLVTIGKGEGDTDVPNRRAFTYQDLIQSDPAAQALVDTFIHERLLIADTDAQSRAIVRLSHEALLTRWPRLVELQNEGAFRDFMSQRRRLESSLRQWQEQNRTPDCYLQPGFELEEGKQLLEKHEATLKLEEREFIRDSVEYHAERERKAIGRRRMVIAGLSTLTCVAIVGGWYGQQQASKAKASALEAIVQADKARAAAREADAQRANTVLALAETAKQRTAAQSALVEVDKQRAAAQLALVEADKQRAAAQSALEESNRQLELAQVEEGRAWLESGRAALNKGDHLGALLLAGRAVGFLGYGRGAQEAPLFSETFPLLLERPMKDQFAESERALEVWNTTKFLSSVRPTYMPLWTSPMEKETSCLAFSPDGSRLAGGAGDKTIKLWDTTTGKVFTTLHAHVGDVLSIAFSPDGNRLASGSWDDTIKLWNIATGTLVATLHGHKGSVYSVVFSPDGSRLASGSWDHTITLWDTATFKELTTLYGHTDSISSMAFSPDGSRLASGSVDGTIKIWDTATGMEFTTLQRHASFVLSVAFSPDGAKLASGSRDNTIILWNTATGKELASLQGHTDTVRSVAFGPDGTRLASGSEDGMIKIWDAASGKELATLHAHSGIVLRVVFSPDGSRLASSSNDKTVRLWDAATDNALQGHTDNVRSVAFSPDSTRLASGAHDKTVRLWDATSGKELGSFNGHTGSVYGVTFSPDGSRVASGSGDGTIKLWDSTTGKTFATLTGHTGPVYKVAFSPDGTYLASISRDGPIKLWQTATGSEVKIANVQELAGTQQWLASAGDCLSPDAKLMAEIREGVIFVGPNPPLSLDLTAPLRIGLLAFEGRKVEFPEIKQITPMLHVRQDTLAQLADPKLTPERRAELRMELCTKSSQFRAATALWQRLLQGEWPGFEGATVPKDQAPATIPADSPIRRLYLLALIDATKHPQIHGHPTICQTALQIAPVLTKEMMATPTISLAMMSLMQTLAKDAIPDMSVPRAALLERLDAVATKEWLEVLREEK